MKKDNRSLRSFSRIFILLTCLFILVCFATAQSMPEFLVYTFKSDPTAKIGYPKGWTVQENQMGAVIMEKPDADSAGIMLIVGQLQAGVTNSTTLSETMVDFLRKQGYPDLQVTNQKPHPQAPAVLTMDATLTGGGIPFKAHMWSWANTQNKIGLFLVFYAPTSRYNGFNAQAYLASCVAPLFGNQPASSGAQSPGQSSSQVSSGTISGAAARDIIFIRKQGNNRLLCAINPATGNVTTLYNFQTVPICQPARSLDGQLILLAVPILKQVMCINGVTSTSAPLGKNVQSFAMKFPLAGESYVNSPSISRDKKLVAVQIRSFTHAGNINVHDATTGAYDSTFVGVHRQGQIASFQLSATIQRQAVYYKDPDLPDMGPDRRGWWPIFSPAANVIIYTYGNKIIMADSTTGSKLREFNQTYSIYEKSGLTLSPDGSVLAYIGTVNRSSFGFKDAPGALVFVDMRNGASKQILLPRTLRPSSPEEQSGAATICLDFSPDGHYVVFSAAPRSAEHDSAEETFRDMAGNAPKECDLYIVDTRTGNCTRLTNDNNSFDPVWKGR